MSKVFRLHGGGTEGTGWFISANGISKENLRTIKSEGKEIASSIPSPFARLDLIKTAFSRVSDMGPVGQTAYHRLVSDTLDIAQLFYAYPKYRDLFKIVAYDPKKRISDIAEDGILAHNHLANGLRLFWDQDSLPDNHKGDKVLYNFEKVKRLYFLVHKESRSILGSTSPISLFWPVEEARKIAKNFNITIGGHQLFGDTYNDLSARENSFIEYIYSLAKQRSFPHLFPEVYEYLEVIRSNHISRGGLRKRINEIEPDAIEQYTACPVLDNENDPCEILGIPLGVQPPESDRIASESDFILQSVLVSDGPIPMVLPTKKFSKEWTYTTKGILWNDNTNIPYKNTDSPQQSRVPIQNDKYYWISTGNFFADNIIKLPYPLDETKFITCGSKSYLLPLSPLYFKYFEANNIAHHLTISERVGNLVEATLRLPVRGGEVILTKEYSPADNNVLSLTLHLAICPFLQTDTAALEYTIGLLDRRLDEVSASEVIANCFSQGQPLNILHQSVRNPGGLGEVKSKYFKVGTRPDCIQVGTDSASGFVVPRMQRCGGNAKSQFAVDFGTTNTHVEYKIGSNGAVAFDNSEADSIWQSLIDYKDSTVDPIYLENEVTFEQEILPHSFAGSQSEHQFPVRTALVHTKHLDFQQPVHLFTEANNYFLLEQRSVPNYLELVTHLKWSNYADHQSEVLVESYIRFIINLIRYKVISLGGDVSQTSILWFYPVSMDEGELGVLERAWQKLYSEIFMLQPTGQRLKKIPESIAPYLYYKSSVRGLSLSIDVGGGSTDIAVFDEIGDDAKMISSFRFAGNAIFGDGYPSNEYKSTSERNGFVATFAGHAKEAVKGIVNKKAILNDILEFRRDSSEFSNFLFALEQDQSVSFNYSRLLQKDKRLKLPILVFYAAVIYYSAQLMKQFGSGIPKHILLSGTASKSASIIDTSSDFKQLSSLFKFFFENVYELSSVGGIAVQLTDIPKQVTCKGALKADSTRLQSEVPVNFWLGGEDGSKWGNTFTKNVILPDTPRYDDIDNTALIDIERSIYRFYELLDKYVNSIQLEATHMIELDAYQTFKSMRGNGIQDLILRAKAAYRKKDEQYVEESLFFYPLVGILNELGYTLAHNSENDK